MMTSAKLSDRKEISKITMMTVTMMMTVTYGDHMTYLTQIDDGHVTSMTLKVLPVDVGYALAVPNDVAAN